jgi:hypothetical protein
MNSLYGIKKAPYGWYEKITAHILKINFKHFSLDYATFFIKKVGKTIVYIVSYADKFLIMRNNEAYIASRNK